MADKTKFGRWRVLSFLGQGGQGRVYAVTDSPSVAEQQPARLRAVHQTMRGISGGGILQKVNTSEPEFQAFMDAIRDAVFPAQAEPVIRAAKEFLPLESPNPSAAKARMKSELTALQGLHHPNIIRVFEIQPDADWFVMDYYPATLAERIAECAATCCMRWTHFDRWLTPSRMCMKGISSIATSNRQMFLSTEVAPLSWTLTP